VYASQYFECDKFLKLLTTVTPKKWTIISHPPENA
jgi:hypothetical protein